MLQDGPSLTCDTRIKSHLSSKLRASFYFFFSLILFLSGFNLQSFNLSTTLTPTSWTAIPTSRISLHLALTWPMLSHDPGKGQPVTFFLGRKTSGLEKENNSNWAEFYIINISEMIKLFESCRKYRSITSLFQQTDQKRYHRKASCPVPGR